MHAVACCGGAQGSVLVLLLPLYIHYFLFYGGGRAHIYSGVSFCYNLGPRTSPV